jgi:hypothetical protein
MTMICDVITIPALLPAMKRKKRQDNGNPKYVLVSTLRYPPTIRRIGNDIAGEEKEKKTASLADDM